MSVQQSLRGRGSWKVPERHSFQDLQAVDAVLMERVVIARLVAKYAPGLDQAAAED